MALRTNLKKFMQDQGLNVTSWSKKAGIAEGTLRHFLSGRNNSLTYLVLEKLAAAFELSPKSFLDNTEPKAETQVIDKNLFTQAFIHLENHIKNSNLELNNIDKAEILVSIYELLLIQKANSAIEEEKIKKSV